MKLNEAFARTARRYPDKRAIVTDDGLERSYAGLNRRSTQLAKALQERLGSARCGVLSRNCPAAIEAMLAGNKRGIATVQIPFRASVGKVVEMTKTASPQGLIFDDACADKALSVLDRGIVDTAIRVGNSEIANESVESYETVLEGVTPELDPALPRDDECAVLYTSGSTATPKAVLFDQEQLSYGAIQGVMEHGIDEMDTALCLTPWYHMITTDAWLYPHFVAGATVVLQSTFEPQQALRLLDRHGVTGLLAVPTQIRSLNDAAREGDYSVNSLSYLRTGGSTLTEDIVEETTTQLCESLYNTYGMTEAGPDLTFAHPSAQSAHPGTVGKEAFTWEIRVVEPVALDENPDPEATVDSGERGEIIARGPGMADGYIDNDQAEARTFFDGWLRTGDIADVDEDRYLYIIDRIDNMVISGGENIYPKEVERVLEQHEFVKETCVLGIDDNHWGEKVAAVVVICGGLTEADLEEFCIEHDDLANFKHPRKYAFTKDRLPRSDTGTIRRETIADRYFDE
jgi:fatty-acyl-CoA synthase